VTPTSHFRCAHRFYSFPGFPFDSSTQDGSYVHVVAPTSALGGVLLDGVPLAAGTTCIGYSQVDYPAPSAYSWTRCRLADPAAGEHTLDGGSVPVGAYVYGFRSYGAYAYPAGIGF
jgi:hypothetical protein